MYLNHRVFDVGFICSQEGIEAYRNKDSPFRHILLDVRGGNPPLFPVAFLNLRVCLEVLKTQQVVLVATFPFGRWPRKVSSCMNKLCLVSWGCYNLGGLSCEGCWHWPRGSVGETQDQMGPGLANFLS